MNRNWILLTCCIGIIWGLKISLFAQEDPRKIYYVEPKAPLGVNPLYVRDLTGLHLSTLIYNSLVARDPNRELKPELLERLEPILAENGIFQFKLRTDVWWFGYDTKSKELVKLKPFTAQDVVYTFQQIRDRKSDRYAFVPHFFSDVRQIAKDVVEFEVKSDFSIDLEFAELSQNHIPQALHPKMRANNISLSSQATLRSIEPGHVWVITDPQETQEGVKTYTYLIRRAPQGGQLKISDLSGLDKTVIVDNLRFAITPDLSGINTGKLQKFKNQLIVGTGLFAIEDEGFEGVKLLNTHQFLRGDSVHRDSQHQHIPRLILVPRTDLIIVFEQLTPSEPKLHLMTEIPLERYNVAKPDPNLTLQPHSIARFTYFAYNCERAFSDSDLRKAFTLAFDRQKAFDDAYGEYFPGRGNLPISQVKEIVHCPLPPHQIPPELPIIHYNPNAAKQLMNAIRTRADENLRNQLRREFTLIAYVEDDRERRICEDFANAIREILQINLKPYTNLPYAEWDDRTKKGDFDIAFGHANFDVNVNVIGGLFGSTSPHNFFHYHNAQIDDLLGKYNRSKHPEHRQDVRKQMATMIAQEVPFTFLYRIPKYAAYRNDVLGGVEIEPYDFFSYIDRWYVKPEPGQTSNQANEPAEILK